MELGKDFKKGAYLNGYGQIKVNEGEKVIINDEVYVKDDSWGVINRFVKLNNNCWYYPCPYYEMAVYEYVDIKEEIVKTNRYRVSNCNKSIMEHSINGNQIEFKIKGRMSVITLIKTLLTTTNIINYKYKRVSPFKIVRTLASMSDDNKHKWDIVFIDVKDNYKEKTSNIIIADTSMCLEGDYNVFIPDLLELMIDKGYVKRNGIGYELERDLTRHSEKITYLPYKPKRIDLEKNGFIVPEAFDNIE